MKLSLYTLLFVSLFLISSSIQAASYETFFVAEDGFVSLETLDFYHLAARNNSAVSTVDFDGDGDIDIISGTHAGYLIYFENNGSNQFQLNNNFGDIRTSYQSEPFPVDWDGDSDIDLVVGHRSGTIYYYENNGDGSFENANTLGSIDVGRYSSVAVADWENDGDLDLFVTGYDSSTGLYPVNLYENDGSESFTETKDFLGVSFSGYIKISATDWNSDGHVDFVIADRSDDTIRLYLNNGSNNFSASTLLEAMDGDEYFKPSARDWDNDGDLDLLVGSDSGRIYYLENNGTDTFSRYENKLLSTDSWSSPVWIDLDQDGDLDILSGGLSGVIRLFENEGNFQFSAPTSNYAGLTVQSDSRLDSSDIDGDGDIDILVGGRDGTFSLFEYDAGIYTEQANFGGFDIGDQSTAHIVDWNSDGFADFFSGSYDGDVSLFLNDGSNNFTQTAGYGSLDFSSVGYTTPSAIDWDNDGDLDLLIGNNTGRIDYYANDGSNNFTATSDYFGFTFWGNSTVDPKDIDSDGDIDVLVGSQYGGFIHLIVNDYDEDGHVLDDDCDDTVATANVSQVEDCTDGIDNDCDETIDSIDSDCITDSPITDSSTPAEITVSDDTNGDVTINQTFDSDDATETVTNADDSSNSTSETGTTFPETGNPVQFASGGCQLNRNGRINSAHCIIPFATISTLFLLLAFWKRRSKAGDYSS